MKPKQLRIFFLFSFLVVVALFLIVQNVGEPQKTTSHATAASTLTFTNTTPQVTPGGTVSIDVTVNPGNNAVSLINLIIDYDQSKLNPLQNGFAPNTTAFPATLDGPTYNNCTGTQCSMYIALSVGNNPTSAITTTTKVVTLNFQAVSAGNTQVGFDTKTQIYSVGAQDQANENVLSTATPLSITIGGTGAITPTILTPIPTQSGTQPTPTTPAQTPTNAQDTTINLKFNVPGIGSTPGNSHPLRPVRDITFYLYNVDSGNLLRQFNSVVFDGTYFTRPIINLGQVPNGNYQIFIHSPQYLTLRLLQGTSSTIPIQNGQAIQAATNSLIAGDIAPIHGNTYGDNVLDILDYNTLISCYGIKANYSTCINKQGADLDDNNVIDAIDYNIILRGFAQTHIGDTIPGNPNL